MTISRKGIAKLYVAYCLCMDSDVFIRVFGGLTADGAQIGGFQSANPVLLLFSFLLIVSTFLMTLPIYRRVFTTLLNLPSLSGLYAVSLLSVLWAVQPSVVIRVGMPLAAYFVCGAITAYYLTVEEAATLLGKLTSGIALLSLVWERLHPVRGSIAPGWTGIYGEKNHLGMGMGVGILALLVSPRPWTLVRVMQLCLCGVLLVGSQSATAIVFVIAAAVLYGLLRAEARLRPLALSFLLACVVLPGILVPHSIEKVFGAAGKSTTFTGRDVIWRYVYARCRTRPPLGFGYYNFWYTEDAAITQNLGWNPGSAHNGFLETLLNTGITGEVLLLCALAGGFRLALRAWQRGHRVAATWLLLAWTALLIDDLTEADFMVPAPLWFSYCTIVFLTYAEVRRGAELRRSAGHTGERSEQRSWQPAFAFAQHEWTSRFATRPAAGLRAGMGEI